MEQEQLIDSSQVHSNKKYVGIFMVVILLIILYIYLSSQTKREISLSAVGDIGDGNEKLSLYLLDNETKKLITVFENKVMTKESFDHAFILPENTSLLFHSDEINPPNMLTPAGTIVDHNTILNKLELDGVSLLPKLVRLKGQDFNSNVFADDALRNDTVKSGRLNWGGSYYLASL